MSFSLNAIGTPEALKRRIAVESENLSGQSKEEFDAVRPAIDTILDQQVGNGAIHLEAYGHASIKDGVKMYGNCKVSINPLGSQLAE